MAIEIIGGRPRSVRTEEEIVKDMVDSLEAMSPDEQAAFIHYLDKLEQGQNDVLDEFINIEYVEEPVSPRTFLLDEYYLGAVGSNMWPKLQDDFVELFEGGYSEAILTGSLGWGKCGTENSYFVDGESGRRFKISQAVGLTPLVPSLDGRNKVSHRRSSKVWKSGQKRCSKMTLVSGHWLEVSLDHPVLCPNGYKPIGELSKGDFVAVARRVPAPLSPLKVTDDEVIVAAALIADGGMTERTITSYTKGNVVLRDEIVKRAHSIQGFSAWRKDKRKPSVFLSGLQDWTEKLGIRCLSKKKRVPGEYFGLCDEQLSLFLRWLFTDGNVYTGSPRKIEITLASEGLIDDIQYLLRRFGVAARKSYRRKKNQDGEFDAWRLQIADVPNQLLFMEHVGFIPGKEGACSRLIFQARAVEKPNSNWDVVPITNRELKEIRKETGPHNNKQWRKLAAMADGSCMGAQRFKRLCEATGYKGRYRKFADMVDDIVWERVESVTDIGIHDVYDLSVPETQNAVINGIVVHNSFFATCGLAYILYQISCLAEPQRVYGLAKGTALAVAILSATREAARRVPLAELGSKLQLSPYFKEKCPYKIAQTMYEIRFPTKKIIVVAGSTSSAAIGTNVFSGFLDEMCLSGDTRILTSQGYKEIYDLYKHDGTITPIMAYIERTGDVVPSIGTIKRATDTFVYSVELDNGTVIRATSKHPFLVKGQGYVRVADLRIGDEVVIVDVEKSSGQEKSVFWKKAHQRVQRENVKDEDRCEKKEEVRGNKAKDKAVEHQNESYKARDRCQWCARREIEGACGQGKGENASAKRAEGVDRRREGETVREIEGTVERPRIQDEDGQGKAFFQAHRRFQTKPFRKKQNKEFQTFKENKAETQRDHVLEGMASYGICQHEKGRKMCLQVAVGEACYRDIRQRQDNFELRVRAIENTIRIRRCDVFDNPRFQNREDRRVGGDYRGKAQGVLLQREEQGEIRGLSHLLQDKGVDLQSLGRKGYLARVVSITSSGSCETFDIMSSPHGNFIAEGVVVHNSFMGGRRQLDKTGRLVEVDKSEVLTKAIIRRMKSRFMKAGKLPGLMFLVSSKEKPVTFIEQKIEEARSGQSPDVFLRDYSTWSVKPVDNFSGKTFQIAVGNETVRSKIKPSPEDIEWYKQSQLRIIDVPEEYFPDFDADLEGALRDIAGIATESVSLFIHRREKIAEAIDETLKSPVDVEEWMSGDPLEFWWERVAIPYKRAIPGGFTEEAWRPIRHPGAVRYAHIDPSLSGDCAGLTILHIAGHTEVTRRDAGGESYEEVAPVIETDFMLKIIPPPGDEIFLGDIRGIIYEFLSHGFQISYASMDSFQSADTRQQFKTRGIESDVLSVDKTTVPYESLKIALYENRLRLQDNVTIQRQLRALQRVQKTKGVIPKFMIDHPARGEKDLADSLAGGVHSLMTRQPGLPMAPLTSGRNSMTEVRDDSWVTGGKVMVPPSSGQRGGRQGMVGQKVSAKNMPMPFTRG